jgi:hypothetical protein
VVVTAFLRERMIAKLISICIGIAKGKTYSNKRRTSADVPVLLPGQLNPQVACQHFNSSGLKASLNDGILLPTAIVYPLVTVCHQLRQIVFLKSMIRMGYWLWTRVLLYYSRSCCCFPPTSASI